MSSPPAPPPTSSAPVPPDWPVLRAKLPGGLVLPGEPAYPAASRSFNPLFDNRKPAAIATCTRPEDVQVCLEVARAARIPVAARAGGHSYAGYSTPDRALVLDLRRMAGVFPEPDGTVSVGAGARLIDVYAGVAAAGRCLPAGTCPSVGIAGLTLGGGIGVLSRAYGLTCDRVLSARVVTADGQLRTVSAEAEPELYWALRGGGGGNFGVVTSFTFSTEAAPSLTVFSLRFATGSATDVLGAWQDWIADLPPRLWTNCVISGGSRPGSRIGGCFLGSPSGLAPLLDRLAAQVRPTSRFVQGKGYLDAMRYLAGCSQRTVAQCHASSEGGQLDRQSFVASSRMLGAAVDPAKVVALLSGRTGVDLLLDSLGGAVDEIAADATAYPHRGALASAQIYANTAAGAGRARRTVAEIRDGLGALTGRTGYVNYIDPAMPDWPTAYYGANLSRLRDVAHRYDPDGVFTFAQAVTAG